MNVFSSGAGIDSAAVHRGRCLPRLCSVVREKQTDKFGSFELLHNVINGAMILVVSCRQLQSGLKWP